MPPDPEEQFRDAMVLRGLVPPPSLVADGQWHRCDTDDGPRGRNDGSYILTLGGFPNGAFENHRDGRGWEKWQPETDHQPTAVESAAAAARIAEAQRVREEERVRRQAAAQKEAADIWAKAEATGEHAYLTRKGISLSGARLHRGYIVVPARDAAGTLHSLQFIAQDGAKRFHPGGRIQGCYCGIGKPDGVLCIAEGFATAASIREATGHAIAVAFDCGNLLPVTMALRAKLPNVRLIICADDDYRTIGNPGITKATEAAKAVGGYLAVPDFTGTDRGAKDSDFNDVARLSGLESVKMMIASAKAPEATPQTWPPLVSLDTPDLPRLGADCLPGWAGDFAAALASSTETPEELAVGLVLATCSVATSRRLRVRVKPDYFEPTNIWCAVALAPGNRKSAVQSAASGPLLEWERDTALDMADEIKRVTSEVKTAEARVKALRTKAASAVDGLAANELARQAAEIEAAIPEIPRAPQLWTSDVTPEKLGVILADNSERMAWLSSEGGVFDILAGRYSGGIPNLDLVLKSHSGDADRVDRGSRPPVFLRHPLLTMGLSPQPEVLRGLAGKPGFRGRGLLGRFLFLLPPSPLGYRNLQTAPIPNSVSAAYSAGLRALLDMSPAIGDDGEERPHLLNLSQDAYAEQMAFAHHIESTMRADGDFETVTDWAGKCPGAAIRIAGILHGIEHAHGTPWGEEISVATMGRALEIMDAVARHSLAAFDLMGADDSIASARKVWDWIKRGRRRTFTERQAFEALKGSFPKMAELRPALAVLAERGYIEIADTERTGSQGRPASPVVVVRPDVSEGW